MLVKLNLTQDGHLAPRAWSTISSLPDSYCFHGDHGKRHPKSVYGGSLRAITQQWARTSELIDRLTAEHNWQSTETSYDEVLSEYRELLYRLNEHHDACLSVLRSLCPPGMAKAAVFDSAFLKAAKLPGAKHFLDPTLDYREKHIGLLVNTMKHSQGELSSIFFYSNHEFRPGYFLRDVLPDGSLSPSGKLHSGGRTAFSFSRDFMMHLWWLYRFGDLLSAAITAAVQGLYGSGLAISPHPMDDTNLLPTLKGCAALKPQFFPDESKKPYPRILLSQNEAKLTLEFPTSAPGHFPKDMKISTAFKVDGSHLTNKLPYFGEDYVKWETVVSL